MEPATDFSYPITDAPGWSRVRDGRMHGLLPLSPQASPEALAGLLALIGRLDPAAEIRPALRSGPNGQPLPGLKLTCRREASEQLVPQLVEAGLIDPATPDRLAAAEAARREQHQQATARGPARWIPGPWRAGALRWLEQQTDTPDKRFQTGIISFLIGDVLGLGVAAANRDWNDAGYSAFSMAGTAVGRADKGRHEGLSEAEKLLVELREDFAAAGMEADLPSLQPPALPPGEQAVQAVERHAYPAFWAMNSLSAANLLKAGINQHDPFKMLSGGLLTGGQLILLARQEGKRAMVDFDRFGEQSGIKQAWQAVQQSGVGQGVARLAEQTGAKGLWDRATEAIRRDPRDASGRLFLLHNANLWLVSLFSWVRSPAEMREIRSRYGHQESENPLQWTGRKLMEGFRWVTRRPMPEPLPGPARFHEVDIAGRTTRHWWDMGYDEARRHVDRLENSGALTPQEHARFGRDVERYFQRQRLMAGGALNALMTAAYTLGNYMMKESGNRASVDLQELYADAALSLAAVPETRRQGVLERMAHYLAARPEVWEHAAREARPPAGQGRPDAGLVDEVQGRILESMERLRQTPLLQLMLPERQAASTAASALA